jgi:hypothetical protein
MIISSLINFVEDKTHIPILAISGVAITSPVISHWSAVAGFITVTATCVAAVFTAMVKIREWFRGRKK